MPTRLLVACAALAVAVGCFAPVFESRDGGADGGEGGGAGGGSGGGGVGGGSGGGVGGGAGGGAGGGSVQPCMQASDCGTGDAGVGFCGNFTGFSCIDRHCLKECAAPRSCNTDVDAGCVTCFTSTGSSKACRASLCQGMTAQGRVETSSCTTWPGTLDAMPGSTVQLSGAQCRYAFQRGNGVQVGTVAELNDGTFLADLPSLGGACTGSRLPTSVERWAFNCDACQFVVAFF